MLELSAFKRSYYPVPSEHSAWTADCAERTETSRILSETQRPVVHNARPNQRISNDALIRYHLVPVALRSVIHVGPIQRRNQADNMGYGGFTFFVGAVYAVFSLAAAAASLGYRYDVKNHEYGFRVLLEGTAILGTVSFIASLGLVYGVMESNRKFVAAWLVTQVVIPLYTVCFFGWAIAASDYKDDFRPLKTAVPYVSMVAGVQLLAMIYCVIAVHKFYDYLKTTDAKMKHDFEALQ